MTRVIDPVERIIADALDAAGLAYTRGPETPAGLDFHLPLFDLHIECKQFHSPRIAGQMARAGNVVAVQGIGAAHVLASWISGRAPE
jgi:hypothetical protein